MPVTDYTPSVADVGAATPTRTRNQYGAVTGTFSVDTTPTDSDVLNVIDRAAEKVALRIGDDIPADLFDTAKGVVAVRAAMLIEEGYWPEQMQNARSPYAGLKTRFEEDLTDLLNSIYSVSTGGSLNNPPSPNTPRGSFPDATPWLERQM